MTERSLEPPTEARTRVSIDDELECETCGNPPEVTEPLDRHGKATDRTHYCTTCKKSLSTFELRPAGDFAKYQQQEVATVSSLNVERLRAAIEHLKRPEVELGRWRRRNKDGTPCCAVGHMAELAPKRRMAVYGLDTMDLINIQAINDGAPDATRKARVIEHLETIIAKAEGVQTVG